MFTDSGNIKELFFAFSLVIHYVYLSAIGWSIAFPKKRIWPPPQKWSWQYVLNWALFIFAICATIVLIILDWNQWLILDSARFFLGVPIAIIGAIFVSWGVWTLGVENTSGLQDGFTVQGPYKFTRNPQYVGDILLFIGVIVIANSFYVLITHTLLILAFVMMPLAEEIWLEEVYGEEYLAYKKGTPRFL